MLLAAVCGTTIENFLSGETSLCAHRFFTRIVTCHRHWHCTNQTENSHNFFPRTTHGHTNKCAKDLTSLSQMHYVFFEALLLSHHKRHKITQAFLFFIPSKSDAVKPVLSWTKSFSFPFCRHTPSQNNKTHKAQLKSIWNRNPKGRRWLSASFLRFQKKYLRMKSFCCVCTERASGRTKMENGIWRANPQSGICQCIASGFCIGHLCPDGNKEQLLRNHFFSIV